MPISGTTEECLGHFLHAYKWEEVQPFVADFVGVEKHAVRRWYNGNKPSGGEKQIKLRVMLELAGYDVEEFKSLPTLVQQFTRMLALDLLTIDEAKGLLGYKVDQGVYGLVLHRQQMLQGKVYRLKQYVESNEEMLEMFFEEARQKVAALKPMPSPQSFAAASRSLPQRTSAAPSRKAGSASDDGNRSPAHADVSVDDSPEVQPEVSAAFDDESLAHAVEHVVRLTDSLLKAVDDSPNCDEIRTHLRFALGKRLVDDTIGRFEAILN